MDRLTEGEEVRELKGEGAEAPAVWILTDSTKNGDRVMLARSHSEGRGVRIFSGL